MRAIEGKNVTVGAALGDAVVYTPFACSTDVSFYLEEEQIEITTQESGRWREWDGGLSTWGLTLRGVTHVAPLTAKNTVFDVLLEAIRRQGAKLQVVFEDGEGNLKVFIGKARIPSIGINAGATGFATDEIEFIGNGGLQIGSIIIDEPENTNEVKSYEYVAAGGESSINYADFIDRTFLGVFRGFPHEMITTGSPSDVQAKVDGVVGEVLFSYAMSAGEYTLIQYK